MKTESTNFSKNLKRYRKSMNISQEYLAQKINVSRTLITKLESGKANPTKQTVDDLCKVFMITEDKLFENQSISSKIINFMLMIVFPVSLALIYLFILPIFRYEIIVNAENDQTINGRMSVITALFSKNNYLFIIPFTMLMISSILSFYAFLSSTRNKKIIIIIFLLFIFGVLFSIYLFIFGQSIISTITY